MDIMSFNAIDIGIVIFVVLSAIIGFVRGFVRESISLTTWIAAIVIAFLFYNQYYDQLPLPIDEVSVKKIVAAVIAFVVVLIIGAIINFFFSRLMSFIGLDFLDRILGSAFGILRGILILSLIVLLLGLGFININEYDLWNNSILIPELDKIAEWIKGLIPKDFMDSLSEVAASLGLEVSNTPSIAPVDVTTPPVEK